MERKEFHRATKQSPFNLLPDKKLWSSLHVEAAIGYDLPRTVTATLERTPKNLHRVR